MYITYYNHPYYIDHLERLGYEKEVDWIEYKIVFPGKDSRIAQMSHRVAERMKSHLNLHIAPLNNRKDYYQYIKKAFELVNKAYSHLYSMVEVNERQIDRYAKKFIPIINPDFVCFVMDENENMVGLGVIAPSMTDALKKCDGKLFPFGFVHVLKALKKHDVMDMYLIAVDPDMRRMGINAIILDHMVQSGIKHGVKFAETGPMLETNSNILEQWKMFDKEQHKRRRCYLKKI